MALRLDLYRSTRTTAYASQETTVAVLTVTPSSEWNTYAPSTDPTGQTTRIVPALTPRELTPMPVLFTPGRSKTDKTDPSIVYAIYEGETPFFILLPVTIEPPTRLNLDVSLLLCNDTECLPVNRKLELSLTGLDQSALPVLEDQPWAARWSAAAPAEILAGQAAPIQDDSVQTDGQTVSYDFTPVSFTPGLEVQGLLKALFLAFLAGIVLNLMPCVLPVISLKMISLLPKDGQTDGKCLPVRTHSIFFALGILAYFLILSLILSLAGLAWGEIFQNPVTVIILTVIVFALSLSLFGIYTLPVIDLKLGLATNDDRHPRAKSFFTGVLVTLLATPCSGPFLGGVLAWTLLQPATVIAAVFLSIGLGMAAPYLAFAVFPCMARVFPRPGAWNQYLEKGMGFILGATCLYLISLLPDEYHLSILTLLWASSISAWMWGQWTTLSHSRTRRWTVRTFALGFFLLIAWFALDFRKPAPVWQDFAEPAFSQSLGTRLLLVDFTADWCPTCKVLEKTVLTPDNLERWKNKYGLTAIKVDLSRKDETRLALLRGLHSQSIPLLAVFPEGEDSRRPLVLRDIVTAGQIEAALDAASGKKR